MTQPNFIYIGTGKAATTWLFEVMTTHPEIFVTPVKETNFFDLNYQRSMDWYTEYFSTAPAQARAVGEISHRYIHTPATAERIRTHLPDVRLLVGLRHPVDYFVSDYLFGKRNGRVTGTLEDWADRFDWDTIAYRTMLAPFVDRFATDRIMICLFDDVKRRPNALFGDICTYLGVTPHDLPADRLKPVNAAASARSARVALLVNRMSKALKRRGGQRIIAAVKYNPLVQKVLFRELPDRPEISATLRKRIMDHAAPHMDWLDATFGTQVRILWHAEAP